MPRRVFFSFHYKDIRRVSQVRNSGIVKRDSDSPAPIDHASWESIKRQGDAAIKKWIDGQLKGSGVKMKDGTHYSFDVLMLIVKKWHGTTA